MYIYIYIYTHTYTHTHTRAYVCLCVCYAFVGLDNQLYKMHGTFIKIQITLTSTGPIIKEAQNTQNQQNLYIYKTHLRVRFTTGSGVLTV